MPQGLKLSDRNLQCMFSDSEDSEPDQLVPLRRVRADPLKLEESCKEEMDQQHSAGSHSGAGTANATRGKVRLTPAPQVLTESEPKRVRLLPAPVRPVETEHGSVRLTEAPQQLTEAESIAVNAALSLFKSVEAYSLACQRGTAGSHSGDGQAGIESR